MRTLTLALCLPLLAAPQNTTPPSSAPDIAALAERWARGEREAWAELQRAIAADGESACKACAGLAPGPARNLLEQALGLSAARSAYLVVVGKIAKVESIQGGVIDYHTLLVHLEEPEFVLGAAPASEELARHRTLTVVRGTSWDWWLADTLKRDLERTPDRRTFVFQRRDLVHQPRQGDETRRGLTYLEYTTFPVAAAAVLR